MRVKPSMMESPVQKSSPSPGIVSYTEPSTCTTTKQMTLRFQRDSWKLRRSRYGSFSMPSSRAKMLILPGRRPFTRSSASWIVKFLRFSNPLTAYKNSFTSRDCNALLNVWIEEFPLGCPTSLCLDFGFIYLCGGGMDML